MDVAPSFLKVIEKIHVQEVTFCADNCSRQNKNWYLFTAFDNQLINGALINQNEIHINGTHVHEGRCHAQGNFEKCEETPCNSLVWWFCYLVDKSAKNIKQLVMDVSVNIFDSSELIFLSFVIGRNNTKYIELGFRLFVLMVNKIIPINNCV